MNTGRLLSPGLANTPNLAYFMPKLVRWLCRGYRGVPSTPVIFVIKQGATSTPEGKLRSKFTRWPPSWIWAFQVSGPPQLLCVSLTILYACQDHVLESLKMAFFVVILDSKYSKMTPKFVKQKSHWLHSSIKFANPVSPLICSSISYRSFLNFSVHFIIMQ